MKKRIIRTIVMTLFFVAAVGVFSVVLNQENQDLTKTMEAATLPVLSFDYDSVAVNELHGYTTEMDIKSMRDTLTPIGGDRILPLRIATYGYPVDSIAYEIRSMDGERLVAKNTIDEYQKEQDQIVADVEIQNVLSDREEYAMKITLGARDQFVYYYTRLIQTTRSDVPECLAFAMKFHDYTFREDAGSFIPTYMDAATGDATTLDYVDLTCTLRQITWADFKGKMLTQPVAAFKEINDSYDVITINYMIADEEKKGETTLYNVEEYYRLRLTEARMYVLNYERRMNQIFQGENSFLQDKNSILLGIRNADIEYATSKTSDIIAFVQEGDLWSFDRVSGRITQIFSFRGKEETDPRDNFGEHEIKIVRVDEAGSIDFVVYGYMNRGEHEGEVGTGVYHYDGLVHTVSEEVFIPSNKSYEILKAEMGQLMYVNEDDMLYLMMNDNVYSIQLTNLKVKEIVTDLKDSCYQTSVSNRYFAWVEQSGEYESDTIHFMDLATGKQTDITDDSGTYLRPLGFMDEDFIYGIAKKGDVEQDAAGNMIFPMNSLKIMSLAEEKPSIVKTYQPQKGKIESIEVADYTVTVHLMKKTDGRYQVAGTDSIMNRVADTKEETWLDTLVTDEKETQRRIVMKTAASTSKLIMISSKMVVEETPRNVSFEEEEGQERFYVYVRGKVVLATDRIADAIIKANESMGVVINSNQQYVWMRARKNAQNAFSNIRVNEADKDASSVVQAISAMLAYHGNTLSVKELIDAGATPKSTLESTLTDSMVLDVSGCTVDEIIFYVSNGSPVFAMTEHNHAILVTGYSASSIYYYDPMVNATRSMSYEAADAQFEKAGKVFFTYLDY